MRIVKATSLQLKEHAYKAPGSPQLEYACKVWPPWQGYLINTLEKSNVLLLGICTTIIVLAPVSQP